MDTSETNSAIVLTTESRNHLNQLSKLVLQTPEEVDTLVSFLKEILVEGMTQNLFTRYPPPVLLISSSCTRAADHI